MVFRIIEICSLTWQEAYEWNERLAGSVAAAAYANIIRALASRAHPPLHAQDVVDANRPALAPASSGVTHHPRNTGEGPKPTVGHLLRDRGELLRVNPIRGRLDARNSHEEAGARDLGINRG